MTTAGESTDPMSGSSTDIIDSAKMSAPAESNSMSVPTTNSSICPTDNVGPISKQSKHRPLPYAKPILLRNDKKTRKRKSLTWQSDEKIQSIRYFELIEGERENVFNRLKMEANQQQEAINGASPKPMLNATNIDGLYKKPKIESDRIVEYSGWRPLILIDFTPTLPSPGWNSIERTAQADREIYVLGAIDLPGKPSTLDEPDSSSSANKDDVNSIKVIPLENPEGMYTEYPNMYDSDVVNGVRQPSDGTSSNVQNVNPTFFDPQQTHSRLLPDQFQQQLVQATSQNPFSFQEMSAQFQQQLPIAFPQQHHAPFNNGGQPQPPQNPQDQLQVPQVPQQTSITGPIMPWLSYPFNPVNESSHAHLFKRPTT